MTPCGIGLFARLPPTGTYLLFSPKSSGPESLPGLMPQPASLIRPRKGKSKKAKGKIPQRNRQRLGAASVLPRRSVAVSLLPSAFLLLPFLGRMSDAG